MAACIRGVPYPRKDLVGKWRLEDEKRVPLHLSTFLSPPFFCLADSYLRNPRAAAERESLRLLTGKLLVRHVVQIGLMLLEEFIDHVSP